MAYDANGFWKPEDDNVVSQTTGLMAGDSPLIKQPLGCAGILWPEFVWPQRARMTTIRGFP